MSRRNREANDSLDMLLDTITNTFGGLIFIAILVALLIGKKAPDAVSRNVQNPDEFELRKELKRLSLQLEIKEQENQVSRRVRDQFVSPNQRSQAIELAKLEKSVSQLLHDIDSIKNNVRNTELANNKKQSELDNLDPREANAVKDFERIQKQFAQEVQQRTSDFDSPILKATSKKPRVLFVKGQEVFEIRSRTSATVNTAHFEKTDTSSADFILGPTQGNWKSKPNSGIRMSNKKALKEICDSLDSGREFIHFAIFEDSFQEFKGVREVLVNNKIEYSLLILKDGDQIVESASTSQPKVQ